MLKFMWVVLATTSLLLVAACSKEASSERVITDTEQALPIESDANAVKEENLAFEYFSEFPEESNGCPCYFSKSKKELEELKYICMSSFSNASFIKVKGQLRKLDLIKHQQGLRFYYIYSDSEYELKIEIKSMEAVGDDPSRATGLMTLKDLKNQKTIQTEYIGECEC